MTETPPPPTVIRNADWLIAWDGREHVFMRDADLAFDATGITHVGKRFLGPVENEIDGRSGMVMPGPVNIHCHPTSEPLQRGLTEERKLGMSTIHEYLQLVGRSNNPQTLAESKRSDDPHLDVVAERPSRIEPSRHRDACTSHGPSRVPRAGPFAPGHGALA